MVIDIEGFFSSRQKEIALLFNEPLVVVDPVDKGRNVASAVQMQKLCVFVAAAQAFLMKPSLSFFYPPETRALTAKELERTLEERGSALVFVVFGKINAVSDVLWGQLYKSQRSLRKLVQLSDFEVLRDVAWSDDKSLSMFVFELGLRCISPVKKHLGPPLEKEQELEKFLAKHQNGSGTVSGPCIEGGRWVVILRRKYTDAVALLSEKLKDGGKNAGVAEQVSREIRKSFNVFVNTDVVGLYEKNGEFAKFLTEFLSGKPKWLDSEQAQRE
jgi:tRNA nucleotidyltransferase (CCA-adding enzyme)